MRRLLLLRHAKAEPATPGLRDHDRILAERGRSDATRLGVYLAGHGMTPDAALVSTAARTKQTWDLVAPELPRAPAVRFEERIYEASPQAILQTIEGTEAAIRTLLVVGHNPGLAELAAMLVATGDVEARQRLQERFPTAALAVITFAVEDWTALRAAGGRLEHFITPRWLRATTV